MGYRLTGAAPERLPPSETQGGSRPNLCVGLSLTSSIMLMGSGLAGAAPERLPPLGHVAPVQVWVRCHQSHQWARLAGNSRAPPLSGTCDGLGPSPCASLGLMS
jgi:hypothetical protein